MKSFIVFALCLAVSSAAVISADPKSAVITKQEFDNIGVDGYKFSYETSDGQSALEAGVLKNVGTDAEAIEVRGFYSFVSNDGVVYKVTYTADENGYKPEGAHIPKAK